MPDPPRLNFSPHDYDELVSRWRSLLESVDLRMEVLVEDSGFESYVVENRTDPAETPVYISTGVHGDECGPVWGLLDWAEARREQLRTIPFLLFPCLNPHGFVENRRLDHQGRDLNRCFEDNRIPVIAAWEKRVRGMRFSKSLNLHEDYDGRGIYLYELSKIPGLGEAILARCQSIIPRDERRIIDGQPFEKGMAVREERDIRHVVENDLGGYPEGIQLYLYHCDNTVTFETPSEWDLPTRILTHRHAIEVLIGLPGSDRSSSPEGGSL